MLGIVEAKADSLHLWTCAVEGFSFQAHAFSFYYVLIAIFTFYVGKSI
jgi:hypothetical protein